MRLKDKVALVTGGGGGLGKGIAIALAREGAHVVVCDVDTAALRAAEQVILACGAPCLALQCDVSSSTDVDRMFGEIVTRCGTVHVLVNNAALVPARPDDEARRRSHYAYLTMPFPRRSLQFTSSLSDAEWHRYWGVNVHGVFYCTRGAAPDGAAARGQDHQYRVHRRHVRVQRAQPALLGDQGGRDRLHKSRRG